jgi:hypothetical protein
MFAMLAASAFSIVSCSPDRQGGEQKAGSSSLMVFEPSAKPGEAGRQGVFGTGRGPGVPVSAAAENAVPDPIPANPHDILYWPQQQWRNPRYEVFAWDRFPSILIFDTADYEVQNRMLKRLAFFAEKEGFRGSLAGDEEIAGLHGWNAHDYSAADLALFFQEAGDAGFPLNTEETELRQILINAAIIRETPEGLQGEGAVVSVSRESNQDMRAVFMAHEGFHGIFYIDQDFRRLSAERWNRLAPAGQQMFLTFLDDQEYDISVDIIIIKEFGSFLLQQDVSEAAFYFGTRIPARIENTAWLDANRRLRSSSGDGSYPQFAGMFSAEAEVFSAYAGQRWGFAAGRVW